MELVLIHDRVNIDTVLQTFGVWYFIAVDLAIVLPQLKNVSSVLEDLVMLE